MTTSPLPSAQSRIAAAIRKHRERSPYMSPPSCCCGWVNTQYGINDGAEHADHLAAVVLASLELTTAVRGPFVHGYEERLAGPWVRVGEKTNQ